MVIKKEGNIIYEVKLNDRWIWQCHIDHIVGREVAVELDIMEEPEQASHSDPLMMPFVILQAKK